MVYLRAGLLLLASALFVGCGAEDDEPVADAGPAFDDPEFSETEPLLPTLRFSQESDGQNQPDPEVPEVKADPEANPIDEPQSAVASQRLPGISTADRPEWPLIEAIRRAPWDRDAILKLADWYDEHDPSRAELVRLQLEISPLRYDDPRLSDLRQKQRQLIEEHFDRWTEPLRMLGPRPNVTFDVGLIDRLVIEEATDDKLACLANIPELRRLHLGNDRISPDGFRLIVSLPELDELEIAGKAISQECIDVLAALPARTSVQMWFDGVDKDAVEAMNKVRLAKLDALSPEEKLSAAVRFASTFDSGLTYGEMMTGFNLSQSGIGDDELRLISGHKHLEGLTLFEANVTTEGIAVLAGMTKLKHLDLGDTYVTSIAALPRLTALESLNIYPAYGYTMGDDGLAAIENYTSLRSLMLYDDDASDATVRRLAGMTKLKKLDLNVGYLEDDSCLESLAGMSDMRRLSVYAGNVSEAALKNVVGMTKLENLTMSIARGDGSGLRHLAGLTELKRLGLSGKGVSDAGLNHLRNLKNLRAFVAQDSMITPAGAEALAARLPRVTILTRDRVVKSPRESYTLQRYRTGSVSVRLPVDWLPSDTTTVDDKGFYAAEDGWDLIGGWSNADEVGPAEVSLYLEGDGSVNETLKAALEYDSDAKVLKRDVVLVSGVEMTSCVLHREDDWTRLLVVIDTPDGIAQLKCSVVPPRYEEFEQLYLAVARSIVVSSDDAAHTEAPVELPAHPDVGE